MFAEVRLKEISTASPKMELLNWFSPLPVLRMPRSRRNCHHALHYKDTLVDPPC